MPTLFSLDGKVAIVTGGNGGIGLGMAKGLAGAGAAIVIAARNSAKSEAARQELERLGARCHVVQTDIGDPASCRTMVAQAVAAFGRLDILVNNAGTTIRKAPEALSLEEWREVIDVNLTSAFVCAQAAFPEFVKAGGGKVINVGSMFSIFAASFSAAYGSSKGGLVQLTKTLAVAWAKHRIQANIILPGWVDTELTAGARDQVPGLNEMVVARTPTGRWGKPADFAGIAVFLASSASDFITGTVIPVDGGFSSQG